ncbi:Axoneme central apparatus protein [Spironucleus salmonicida]|uniref:Axoneme central apparatus protein n=1 Tax=Spironucleus salmonicida TaxID=348837 RepID=V6M803_9EUKA|nr:Axoneme central apparatus protein [Spironucleus salmonicida]|eukprot:EST49609.1 Axoneme central apparatus protein [Spironucleus salmonicida]
MTTNRFVVSHFETYQRARQDFVQNLAELSQHPQNVDTIKQLGGVQLCRALLADSVPAVQHAAATALGRMANFSEEMAELIVASDVLPQLVYSISEQNRHYQKAAAFVLRSVSRHSPTLAQAVVDSGALEPLVACLDEFDAGVKESAAWAVGYIARHNEQLASAVVDAGAIPFLITAAQEPELSLKNVAVSALSDIAKHTPELAQSIVDAGAISYIAPLINSKDCKVRRQVCACLAQISKHSVELAELVIDGDIFPKSLNLLRDKDEICARNAATLIREIVKHTSELAQTVVSAGGIGALIEFISVNRGQNRLPGIMAIGFISAFSETLALSIIVAKGVTPLVSCLVSESEDHIIAATVWVLGQIGRHTPEHARAVCDANVLPKLLGLFMSENSSEDLKQKCKRSIKFIVQKTNQLPALDPLLHQAPPQILKHVVAQYAKILPKDVQARRQFVTSGGLARLQQIEAESGTRLFEAIEQCNQCFPDEIVRYYTRKPDDMLELIK